MALVVAPGTIKLSWELLCRLLAPPISYSAWPSYPSYSVNS
jgi:hypothetical protein